MRLRLFAFALLTLFSATAAAQSNDADAHFNNGAKLYFQEKYADSIVEFKRGYAIDPHPMFQVNMALAYWRLDNLDEAISHAVKASKSDELDKKTHTQNDARLVAWRMTRNVRATVDSIEAAKQRAAAAAAAAKPQVVATAPPPAPKRPLFDTLGWVGVGTGAAGAAILIGWSVVELSLDSQVVAFREAGQAGDRQRYDALRGEIQRKQGVARVLLFGGGGLLAIGAALVTYDVVRHQAEASPTLALGPHGEPIVGWVKRF